MESSVETEKEETPEIAEIEDTLSSERMRLSSECKNLGTVAIELSKANVVKVGYILTGALGELDSDQADLAIGGMTINPERERYIDFSEPWSYHGIRILEKSIQIPRDSPMQSFLQPLKSSLWTALFISVLTVGLVIFCLDLKSPFDRFYRVRASSITS
ncbi:hypothetical protein TELCIR_02641 [Teladorsagia circumcincta]|uniref:Ionotropic glutamate receptor L-glutamate and glycine-binding domain-containing protein n=1 Tax=Teladorsagia circumcincta TaxID=45464 RepID=A0A2G9UYJ6_TELCI|nr:hypothetical protein TELCIR_02641 [Teladorsagia circumcincta]